ncbi:SAF domain-containing protein [Actinophytocola algeriensis]|jgi:Flp pilus assembly protein CpaB|uniref:Flp pilus assembly protein CpaB n=1 Tax=Actinophytocola algeriensis TaxID=1768010 RepID=A0A7W7QCQ5_9PSEU|nr:SAF domain-containing protein [Actinophytocola algeriensis]MBB4911152.1 Flp pilus assembly protein CpaB [Actinophytocola algeriensis]MBE1479091.1 Flp pilus assembly protein CpaB [Actinophytocola algeriensis]
MKLPLRGWPRRLAIRRLVAVLLVLAAAALAIRPQPRDTGTVPMLTAARDLTPGTTLSDADLTVSRLPPSLRPKAALTDPAQARGRVLAAATTAGEPLTGARLLGRENTRLTSGDPSAAAVPFRLADPAVASLLTAGLRVDVVTVSPSSRAEVLATNATVVTVRPADEAAEGHLVVLALPREEATRVAAASLGQPVAVTLR